jgi:cobalt-zinc-cadmium efflux system membrane fusion protein
MKTRALAAAIPLALALGACGGSSDAPTPESAEAPSAQAGYFTVAPEQLAHLQIVPVKSDTFTASFQTTGTVAWDNDHTTQAISQVSGPISRILVDTGTHVRAGQPLLYVASPDVSSAISTYRKATNRLALAQRNLARNRDLLAHKAISQRELEEVEADYNDAETDVKTALEALRVLGVRPQEVQSAEQQSQAISPELPMRSPIVGTIVEKLVTPGQLIEAGSTTAFVISDVSTVWVQAHVYERNLPEVHVGDAATVKSPSSLETFEGRVAYVGSMLDPATRTTPVRVVTKNPHALLKQDQFVDVTIHDKASHDALVVPTSAVLYDEQNLPFVYVQVDGGKFARRSVTLGAQHDDRTEVADGVKAGDAVVSQGSVFLQFANSYQG